jgi:hypothetical protein
MSLSVVYVQILPGNFGPVLLNDYTTLAIIANHPLYVPMQTSFFSALNGRGFASGGKIAKLISTQT